MWPAFRRKCPAQKWCQVPATKLGRWVEPAVVTSEGIVIERNRLFVERKWKGFVRYQVDLSGWKRYVAGQT